MTASRETVQQLMIEVGPHTDEIEAVVDHGGSIWAVRFDDESVVTLEFAGEPPSLAMSTEIGMPLPVRKIEVYERLLSVQRLRAAADGPRTDFVRDDDALFIVSEFNASPLSLDGMRDALLAFRALSRDWHEYVVTGADAVGSLHAEAEFA